VKVLERSHGIVELKEDVTDVLGENQVSEGEK
jgi:hypothetical protein